MPKLVVVFDTNVYRQLSDAQFEALRRRERECSVIGVASHSVMLELLRHLGTPGSPAAGHARSALRRLAAHCAGYDGSRNTLRGVATLNEQIGQQRFGHQLYEDGRRPVDVAWLVSVCIATTNERIDDHRDALAEVAQYADSVEANFADSIWEMSQREIAPGASGWGDFVNFPAERRRAHAEIIDPKAEGEVADGLARRFAAEYDRHRVPGSQPFPADEERLLADWIGERLRPVVRLHVNVLARIVAAGLDLRRSAHRNSVWDLNIASEVLSFAEFDPAPFWLVTGDHAFLGAARASAGRARLLTLDEYQGALADGTVRDL